MLMQALLILFDVVRDVARADDIGPRRCARSYTGSLADGPELGLGELRLFRPLAPATCNLPLLAKLSPAKNAVNMDIDDQGSARALQASEVAASYLIET